jgi:hypothetical protein
MHAHDEGNIFFVGGATDARENLRRQGEIQVGCKFVGDHDAGMLQQSARYGDALALPAAQTKNLLGALVGDAHHVERGLGPIRFGAREQAEECFADADPAK